MTDTTTPPAKPADAAGGAAAAAPTEPRAEKSMSFGAAVSSDSGFFGAIEGRFGPVSVVINNAAVARYGPLDEFAPEEIQAEIATKLLGGLFMARRAIQSMRRASPGGGDILFISSAAAPGVAESAPKPSTSGIMPRYPSITDSKSTRRAKTHTSIGRPEPRR